MSLLFSCGPSNEGMSVDGLEGTWGLVKTESYSSGEGTSPGKTILHFNPSDPSDGYIKMEVRKEGKHYAVTRYIWAEYSSKYEKREDIRWTVKGNKISDSNKKEATFTISGDNLTIESTLETEMTSIFDGVPSSKLTIVDRYEFVRLSD